MSHLKEREEKVCLNCGAALIDRYCHHCGQENVEPKETVGHLIGHFFADLFHFDGKFFATMKYLAIRPGFLTEEYVKGRRQRYVNPIRMYLFVSAVFFLILMTFFMPKSNHETNTYTRAIDSSSGKYVTTNSLNKAENDVDMIGADTVTIQGVLFLKKGNTYKMIEPDKELDTANIPDIANKNIKTVHQYDSIQNSLAKDNRAGVIEHYFTRRFIAVKEYKKEHPGEFKILLLANFYHSLPYMLFFSLPILALLLKLLYIRRKQFYYVAHAVFTVHYYIFFFISLLIILLLGKTSEIGAFLTMPLVTGWFVYLYIAMYKFYRQGHFKTFTKFFLFCFIGGGIISFLTFIAAINSFLNIGSFH